MGRDIIVTRGGIGQFGSFIGATGILGAILGFIWQGRLSEITLFFLVAGIGGIVLWVLATPRDFVGFVTGRQARQSTIAIFSTLFLIGIVSAVYILVQRERIVADMTIDSRFSLSEQTMEILRVAQRTPRPIQITGFYYPTEITERTIDDQYFQLYESATNGHIRRYYVNPIEQPGFAQPFMPAIEQGLNLFVSYVNEDGTLDFENTMIVVNTGSQERNMTQAIAQLLSAGEFKIYFERGLDTPDPIDNSQQGMSIINNLLRQNGFVTEALSLRQLVATGRSIPQDASAVVIMRPRRSMTEAEVTLIDAYLQNGGALFIGADFFFDDDAFMRGDSPFNRYLWERYGLRMKDAVVVDLASSGATALDVISAVVFTDNDIGFNINIEGQPETRTQFSLARAIEVDDDPPVMNGRVIMSSPVSWGETNYSALVNRNEFNFDEGEDFEGPMTLVAWAFDARTNAKIVLVGDGGFATNGQIQTPAGNGLLFLDSVGWLTGFTESVRIEPRAFAALPVLFVDGQALDLISLVTIVLMPGGMLVIAGIMALRRWRG